MTFLLIGLIISMLVYAYKIIGWAIMTVKWYTNPENEHVKTLESLAQKRWIYVFGGVEHLIIFASLLAATLIIY